jgi:hypothetical protein
LKYLKLKTYIMKKNLAWIKASLFPSIILFTFTSCQKEVISKNEDQETVATPARSEPARRAYSDNFVNELVFVPDFAGGWTAPDYAPAWIAGTGEGNASHLGKAKMYFNQYNSFTPDGISTVAAPVTQSFAAELAVAGFSNISPAVSLIMFDERGNSICFHHTSINTTLTSPTHADVVGSMDIIGGSGKFNGATGQVVFNAFFNPQNLLESSSRANGWISY